MATLADLESAFTGHVAAYNNAMQTATADITEVKKQMNTIMHTTMQTANAKDQIEELMRKVDALEQVQSKAYNRDAASGVGNRMKAASSIKPDKWESEKDGPFSDMCHDVKLYMDTVYDDAGMIMDKAQKTKEAVNRAILLEWSDAGISQDVFEIDKLLYNTLSAMAKGEAKSIIRNATGCGVAAWQSLHRHYSPMTTTDVSMSIMKIMHPVRGKDAASTKAAVEKFETNIREHNSKFEKIHEDLMIAGLKNLAPIAWYD
jgi:hypothetical protein